VKGCKNEVCSIERTQGNKQSDTGARAKAPKGHKRARAEKDSDWGGADSGSSQAVGGSSDWMVPTGLV